MYYMEILQEVMGYDTEEEVKDCCISIITELMHYNFAFIDFETETHLGVFYTAEDFTERFVIIQKKYIHSISIVYRQDIEIEKKENNGYF